MEYLQSLLDSLLTEQVVLGLYRAPFWMWIAAAAALGALTLWTYWRCFVEVRRRELQQEARDELVRAMAPDIAEEDDEDEPGGEAHALRYRNWALETRLRRALEAARAGEPLSAEALSQGLDEILDGDLAVGDDGAPAEAISALKYRNWRLEMRLAQLEDAAAEAEDVLADEALDETYETALPVDAVGEGDAETAALVRRIEQLEEDKSALQEQASGLRYRRWLLARRLGDAVEAARAGSSLSIDALMKDLERDGEAPRFGEPGANPFLGAAMASAPAATIQTQATIGEAAPDDTAQAASLRYRLWLAQGELRRLRSALAIARPAPRIIVAGSEADKDEARRLRRQLSLAEQGLRSARSAAAATASDQAQSAELRVELQSLRAQMKTQAEAPKAAAPSAKDIHQQKEQTSALRARLALSLAEVERLQSQLARGTRRSAAPAPAPAKDTTAPKTTERSSPTLAAQNRAPIEPRSLSDDPQSAIRAALADAIASPRRGVEDAARELIESGQVVADASNQPIGLAQASAEKNGAADALTLIQGVTPQLEARMNGFGLRLFRQIAQMAPFELAWLDGRLDLAGAALSERWLPQAELLAKYRDEGGLRLDASGRYGLPGAETAASPPPQTGSLAFPAEETVETLPAHPRSVRVDSPFSGAEAAALELLNAPQKREGPNVAPSSFSREAFGPQDDLDDLQAVQGVGPKLEAALRALGVGRYRQLAVLTPEEAVWLDRRLGLGGRVIKDRWLAQARLLAERAESERAESERRVAHPAGPSAPPATPPAAPTAAAPPPLVISAPIQPVASASPTARVAPHSPPAPSVGGVRRLAIVPAQEQNGGGAASAGPLSEALSPIEREAIKLIESGLGAHFPGPSGLLSAPSGGAPDSLRRIEGINATLEQLLNDLGVFYFRQLAAFSAEDLAWLDSKLSFRGRVARDRWISQAAQLAGPSVG